MATGRLTYWAVIWGNNIRMAEKCVSPRTACLDAYGMAASDMETVDLGPVKALAHKEFEKVIKERNLTAK